MSYTETEVHSIVDGQFAIELLKTAPEFEESKHIDRILWVDELIDEQPTMDLYIATVKERPIPEYVTDNPDYDFVDYQDHIVIGICEINMYLKLTVDDESRQYLYLITDPSYSILFISVNMTYPLFWYKFHSREELAAEFDNLFEIYSPQEYDLDFPETSRGFMGTDRSLQLTMDEMERHFIINPYTEILIWGSKWLDHPFRHEYLDNQVTGRESLFFSKQAMEQINEQTKHVSVRSLYSKSIITVEYKDKAFLINIKYKSINTPQIKIIDEDLGREFPTDMPIDVVMAMINFPFITHLGMLRIQSISNFNFMIAGMLANSKKMFEELMSETKILIEKYKNDPEIVNIGMKFLRNLEANCIINEIFNDDAINVEIAEKVNGILNRSVSFEKARIELTNIVKEKLDELNVMETDVRDYIITIMVGILKCKTE